jgi:hypothetical protein
MSRNLILVILFRNLPGGTEEDHNKSESAGVSAEIRSEHLWNTRLEHYYLYYCRYYYCIIIIIIIIIIIRWDSPVGIRTGYRLVDRSSIPGRSRGYSLFYSVRIGSETHPASYPMDHLPPTSAEVKDDRSISPLPHTPSWRGA